VSEEKYKEINVRLKRLVVEERKSLQQVRQNYAQELKSRTELELLLRQCVEDVRKEIARRKLETAQFGGNGDLSKLYSRNPGAIPVEEFTQEDRERALELLLSQERVVTLLYAKAFPVHPKKSNLPLEPHLSLGPGSGPLPGSSIGNYGGGGGGMGGILGGDDDISGTFGGGQDSKDPLRPQTSGILGLGPSGDRDRDRDKDRGDKLPSMSGGSLGSGRRPSSGK